MCVEFEAAKYVPTNWMTDCRNKNWNQLYDYQWLFKWKVSYCLRAETNLNKRLLRNSVNTSLSLTNAISFIITVTKIVASGHELWQLAKRRLSWVKKLANAMICKGISAFDRTILSLDGKKHLLQKRKKRVSYQVSRVHLECLGFLLFCQIFQKFFHYSRAAYHVRKSPIWALRYGIKDFACLIHGMGKTKLVILKKNSTRNK